MPSEEQENGELALKLELQRAFEAHLKGKTDTTLATYLELLKAFQDRMLG